MRIVGTLLAAFVGLCLVGLPAQAQMRSGYEASDNVFTFDPPAFNGAVVPNQGVRRFNTAPTTPTPVTYNGEWVYTYTPEILPLPGNGFAWFRYVKTCINGNCDPNEGAGLADWCPVDGWGVFSGANSAFCPRRAIYG